MEVLLCRAFSLMLDRLVKPRLFKHPLTSNVSPGVMFASGRIGVGSWASRTRVRNNNKPKARMYIGEAFRLANASGKKQFARIFGQDVLGGSNASKSLFRPSHFQRTKLAEALRPPILTCNDVADRPDEILLPYPTLPSPLHHQ